MPGSSPSLESLSSPSPSPPPQDEQHSNHSNHSGPAGLGSDSELSELTEDEQDNEHEDDAPRAAARKKKQRGDLVPQSMWDWALKKKKPEKKDPRSKFEEEEEEEQAGPAKAMEEEEDDDQEKGMRSDRDVSLDKDGALSDNDAPDDDEDEPPEADGESADEEPPLELDKANTEDISGDEQDDPEDADPDEPDVPESPKGVVASPDLTDEENENEGEDEIEEDEGQDADPTPKEGSEVDEDEEEVVPDDVDVPELDEPPTTEAVTPANGAEDTLDADVTMDVDTTTAVLMSPVAVAASSIMAGSSVLQPPSPSSSQPSTPSHSRQSSRFPSAEPEQERDVPSEPEAEPEPEPKVVTGRGGRARKGKARSTRTRRPRAAAAAEPDVDGELEHPELADGDGADAEDDVATPDIDLDSDMQPAHRAEALDVLAGIELKFALLRERLYVEKMDSLAWEEGLIADGTHPELLHLHAELSMRRDKRLELAARRRECEIENVRKRRKLDEAGAWSTWKDQRDELQKVMIAETNGRKRKLERERKVIERPPLARHFPMPLHDVPPAPSLREIVKSTPFGLPDSTSYLGKRAKKKEQSRPVATAYPTLAPLSRGEVFQDLELFYNHRHIAASFDPHRHMPGLMNAVLGGGVPPGMDPYAMGMPMMDGPPGRFVPPVQQQHMQPPGMPQNFGPHPRLPHHHSAPPGAIPHMSHAQMQMEQEMHAAMRQPLHPSQFGPGPGPGTLMRRSISPVPLSNGAGPGPTIPTTIGGGPVPPGFSGPKPNGWSGPSGKEPKRMNGDIEGRDRERMSEVISQRTERERIQRELDREREREAERAYHMSYTQPRHAAHPHIHVHGNPQGPAAHNHSIHNHVHPPHHHHIHHHHHHLGPGGNGPSPPMVGLPSGPNVGPSGQSLSPHSSRDHERRPRSGAPSEVIELQAAQRPPLTSPRMSAFWQGNDEPPPLSIEHQRHDRDRERARAGSGPLGPPPPGPNEPRLMTPFTMGPSQSVQRSLPGSPRNHFPGAGPSNPSPAMTTSRRESWSVAVEEHGHGRPPSAPHVIPGGGPSGASRPPTTRLPQPPSNSFHSPFGSPPHNGRVLPPASPSSGPFPGPLRSPVRASQQGRVPLGGPSSPPPTLPHSPRLMGSPGTRLPRMSSPGPAKGPLPKMGGFPIPESGNIAPIMASVGGPTPRSPAMAPSLPAPATLLPPLSALSSPGIPGNRIPNGSFSEKVPPQLPGPPLSSKVVPVDGS